MRKGRDENIKMKIKMKIKKARLNRLIKNNININAKNKMKIKKRLYTNFHDNYSAYKIQSIWRKSLYYNLSIYKTIQSKKKSVI